jgi:hypothetical protein
MINNGGITLNNAVNRQVATEASVCDLLILENPDSSFDRFDGTSTSFEDSHGHTRRTTKLSALGVKVQLWKDVTYSLQALR